MSEGFDIREEMPPLEAYNRLRVAAGWNLMGDHPTLAGLGNSLYSVCVHADGKVIGCARVVGDGYMKFYVEEVMVDPEYRLRGVASLMMKSIMAWFYSVAFEGSYIGLMSNRGLGRFYEKYGFKRRPDDMPGMQYIHRTE